MVIHNISQVVDTMGMVSHAADGVGVRVWLGLGRGWGYGVGVRAWSGLARGIGNGRYRQL